MPIRFWSLSLVGVLQFSALRGCDALLDWQLQSQAIAESAPNHQPCERWGDGRGLSPEQETLAKHLAWPQTYGAVLDRLGYPDCRTETVDIYLLPSGGTAQVQYSGKLATSIHFPQTP